LGSQKSPHERQSVSDVERASYSTDGFHTWTVDEVRQFEERHPIGTKARLALALMLFTGARRGDVVTLGKQHVKDGFLRYIPRKTRHQRMTVSEKPVLPILADIIAKSPTGDLTFLVTKHCKPFTANGFGNWFRDRCDEAGLPQCSAHGLRKAGATIAAENGATDRQLMAMFDWTTPEPGERLCAGGGQEAVGWRCGTVDGWCLYGWHVPRTKLSHFKRKLSHREVKHLIH
jgi:integrase